MIVCLTFFRIDQFQGEDSLFHFPLNWGEGFFKQFYSYKIYLEFFFLI